MRKFLFTMLIFSLLAVANFYLGCASGPYHPPAPKTFSRATSVEWSIIQLRDGIDYDTAWGEVFDIVAKDFEMDMISKDGGYVRTEWIYTWNKDKIHTPTYRVRIIYKFSADRKLLEIKSEAMYLNEQGTWLTGTDTSLLETVKTDIMGFVGRTVI